MADLPKVPQGNPLLILLASAGIVIAGSWVKEGGWPKNGSRAVLGFLGLMVVLPPLAKTSVRPLVLAWCWLILLGAAYGYIPALSSQTKKKVSPKQSAKQSDKKEA